jgi:uncharacterized protein YjbI with pentapeptide repeats
MSSKATAKAIVGLALLAGTSVVSLGLSVGPATAAAAIKEPGKPTEVSALGVNTAIYVSWAAPQSNGGSPITGYLVTASNVKSHKKKYCETTGATSCTAAGLVNGKTYAITVKAKNKKETGSASAPVNGTPSSAQDCAHIGPHANLQDCDLSSANLSNADLAQANLTGADLTDANLTSATITDAYLNSANLSAANLTSANLQESEETDADIAYATLTNADLGGTTMPAVNLTSAILTDANLTGSDVADATLTNTDLTGTTLTAVLSGGIVGTPSSLPSDWTLASGYLIGPGANLSDANLSDVDLTNSDLVGANLTGADVVDATLTNAGLSGATLTSVSSGGIVGTPSSLPLHWMLASGYLIGPEANLSDADLSGVNLTNSDLSFANLTGANLSAANLTDAYLNSANLTDADLTGVTWQDTICPDGTNSDNDGSTCVNNLD